MKWRIPLQVYEDPLSCNHYFKCANGTLSYEQCENGLLFEPATALAGAVHNHCSYNWAAQCVGEDKVRKGINTGTGITEPPG